MYFSCENWRRRGSKAAGSKRIPGSLAGRYVDSAECDRLKLSMHSRGFRDQIPRNPLKKLYLVYRTVRRLSIVCLFCLLVCVCLFVYLLFSLFGCLFVYLLCLFFCLFYFILFCIVT